MPLSSHLRHGRGAKLITRLAALGLLFSVLRAIAQTKPNEVPEANPGRPTVSTPATLTPIGYLQFENGGLYAAASPEFSRRLSVEQVTKLTVLPRLQFILLSEPFTRATGADLAGGRVGDLDAGFQAVLLPSKEKKPTVSVSYLRNLYGSPAPDLDIGSFQQSALILVSDDFGKFHVDVNAIFNEQADESAAGGRVRRGQFGQTLSVSRTLRSVEITGELWHFTQPLTDGNAVGNLWALSSAVKKNLVLDAGFAHGLTSSSTRWQGFAGCTYVLPHRLWRTRS